MIILLLLIFLGLTIVFLLSDWLDMLSVVTAIGTVICMVSLIVLCVKVSEGRVIDQKIAMYTEENAVIESQINEVVTEYMKYETDTFTGLKEDSAITLVSLYPELKSDELVKTQIATYTANNEKIKSLKESKINQSVYRWWLYFGK